MLGGGWRVSPALILNIPVERTHILCAKKKVFFFFFLFFVNGINTEVWKSNNNQIFWFVCFIQFNAPFKIISAHMRWANQKVERKRENPEKNRLAHKQNLACLTCGQYRARTHTRHSGEMIE